MGDTHEETNVLLDSVEEIRAMTSDEVKSFQGDEAMSFLRLRVKQSFQGMRLKHTYIV